MYRRRFLSKEPSQLGPVQAIFNILKLHLNPNGLIRVWEAPQNTAIKLGLFFTASFYAYFKVTSFWMWEHGCPSNRESTILVGWSPPWNDGHQ